MKETKQYLYGTIKKSSKKALSDNVYTFVASTEAEDRDGDVIKQSGWQLDNFKKNPVLMWNHDYSQPPIGTISDVFTENNQLIIKTSFGSTVRAKEIKQLVDDRILKAVSVGFIPKSFDEGNSNVITGAELLEVSVVGIPANPEALRKGLECGYSFDIKNIKRNEIQNQNKQILKLYRKFNKQLTKLTGINVSDDENEQIKNLLNEIQKLSERTEEENESKSIKQENPVMTITPTENQYVTLKELEERFEKTMNKYIS